MTAAEPGVSATIRLPNIDFQDERPSRGGAAGDSAWASRGSAGAGVVVVAGAATQLGLHFIRLLIESRDFGSILVRGLVPSTPAAGSAVPEQLQKARRALDRFCGEDTSRRVELVSVPYFSHAYASVAVDSTVGSSLDPRLGIRPGTLLQSQCLQRAALRKAMAGCLYVISCWGSELQPVFRSNGGELGDGDGARGVADVVGAEYGSIASLLSEAARQSAVHFVHVSAILGQSTDSGSKRVGGIRHWWSSWSLSALLYRSSNEQALLWKERAEHLVRRAGVPERFGGCGLPYTIIRLAPLTPRMRPKRIGSALLYRDAIAVGSSATAEVTISQIAGSIDCRRRTSIGCSAGQEQLHWGPIWEPRRPRPVFADVEASLLDPGREDLSGCTRATLKLDPVDAARVVLFCMGNSATLGTSFEVRGREIDDDAGSGDSGDASSGSHSAADKLPDLLAPLLPDDALHLPYSDDEAFLLCPRSSSSLRSDAPTSMWGDLSTEVQGSTLPVSNSRAISSCAATLVRVAPWSRVIAAEKIALIDDSTNARMPHPLARDSEWEPFVCYTVRMQLVLPLLHPQEGTLATDTRDRDHTLPLEAANIDASAGASASLKCTKPSGELQNWFVCFRFTDFVRLQQALERNISVRQQQQDAWAYQRKQQQYVTHAFMDEQQDREYKTVASTGGSPLGEAPAAAASCAEFHAGELLQHDRKLVMELRALLPPARWFKTEDDVVLERRTALQAYLDLALQAKGSGETLEPVCSSASDGTVPTVVVSRGDADAQCAGDLVQRWVSIAFARCASASAFSATT
eukprot:COSAG02_NODE_5770_length_4052_cov_1.852264_2_plen_803_part_00